MILIAYGTRPEIIKLFPVVNALVERGLPHRTLFTGQHTDLYEDVKDLVPHRISVSPTPSPASEAQHPGRQLREDLSGRGSSTRAAFRYRRRQGDDDGLGPVPDGFPQRRADRPRRGGPSDLRPHEPLPRGLNRTLITQIADYNFAPTRRAFEILVRSGARNVHLVGNTIVDAVDYFKKTLRLTTAVTPLVPVTLHRRENHAIIEDLFRELERIATKYRKLKFVLPIHPNPHVRKHRHLLTAANIQVIDPVGYPECCE